MPLLFVKEDITKMKVDAIVNAANTELRMGSGVCGAIFHAAGEEKMTEACQKLSPIRTGEAVMTDGFALPAGHVIHAAGPVYQERELAESALLLTKTYQSALALAAEHRLKSVAFPLISAGIYGYPKDEALSLAVWAIRHFLEDHEMDVYLAFRTNQRSSLKSTLSAMWKSTWQKARTKVCRFSTTPCRKELFRKL